MVDFVTKFVYFHYDDGRIIPHINKIQGSSILISAKYNRCKKNVQYAVHINKFHYICQRNNLKLQVWKSQHIQVSGVI